MRISEQVIKQVANNVTTLSDLLWDSGYSARSAGSNTMRRLKRVLGKRVYNEIVSHRRASLPKREWNTIKSNRKAS